MDVPAGSPPATGSPPLPAYVLSIVSGAALVLAGLLWDIAWHSTIGRDTFWSPPHALLYLGGVLAGVTSGWVVLKTTFRWSDVDVDRSVRVWGMRGPIGTWITIWGTFAMLTSAPFDNWWHNAYGLDVAVLSPPHALLGYGMMAIALGGVVLLVAHQNRGEGDSITVRVLYTLSSALFLTFVCIFISAYCLPNQQHAFVFYFIAALVFPAVLGALGRASHLRWPVTSIASWYVALTLGSGWLFQLIPASPRLGPILNPVDHLVPYGMPLMLVVPGLAMDLVSRRLDGRGPWFSAVLLGLAFFVPFFVTQWCLSAFLLTPAADNALFMGGTRTLTYATSPGANSHLMWRTHHPLTAFRMACAMIVSVLSARGGIEIARELRRIVR